jgi:SNF family Na+-dependent transporter
VTWSLTVSCVRFSLGRRKRKQRFKNMNEVEPQLKNRYVYTRTKDVLWDVILLLIYLVL